MQSTGAASLIARCIGDDDAAKAEFIAKYAGLVQRAAARQLARWTGRAAVRADVEDICNDVFTYLLLDGCRPLRTLQRPERLTGWLAAVAQNRALDHLRKQGARARLCCTLAQERQVPSYQAPGAALLVQERAEQVHRAIEELAPLDRLAVEFFYYHGLKYAEIGAILGLKINTVAARLHRARSKLRVHLEEAGYGQAG